MHSNPSRRKINPARRRSRGFSLLELLLAASLLPLVSFVIFSNLSSGMRLWQALNRSIAEEDLNVFYRKTASDLDRAFKFSALSFEGNEAQVSFAATIDAPSELGGEFGIGRITITYDEAHHLLTKQEQNVSNLYKESTGPSQVLLKDVAEFQASYYGYDAMHSEYAWGEGWDASKKGLPLAIRFVCRLGSDPEPQTFTFPLAAGG